MDRRLPHRSKNNDLRELAKPLRYYAGLSRNEAVPYRMEIEISPSTQFTLLAGDAEKLLTIR